MDQSHLEQPKAERDIAGGDRHVMKRLVGNAGLLLGGRAFNGVLGLAHLALAARALGAADLGVLVLIHAFAQLVADVMKFQSWQTVLHYGARPLAEQRTADFQRVVRFALALDLGSTLLALMVGVSGALLLGDRLGWGASHATPAAAYMLTIVAAVSATPIGLMRLFDRFDTLAQQTALIALLRLAGSAVAFALHAPLEGFLLAWGVGQLGGFIWLTVATLRELDKRDLLKGFSWRGPLTGGMPGAWRFAWNTNLSATLDVAFSHAATLAIGALVGPAQAAYWRLGRQVADALAKPARLLIPALYPELARLHSVGDERAMWRLARRVGLLAGSVGTVLLAVSAVGGAPLLILVMGKAFAPAALVMTWQVGAAVIGIFALPLEPLLISLGRTGAVVGVQFAVGASYLAALPFLLQRYSLTGAAVGLVAVELGLGLGLLWFLRPARRFRDPAG